MPADDLVILRSGRVLNYVYNDYLERKRWGEKEIVAEMFTAPSVLGLEALEDLTYYRSRVEAFETSTIQRLDKEALAPLLHGNTEFRMQLLASIVARTRKRQDFLAVRSLGFSAAVAFTLLDLAEGPSNKILGVTQPTIGVLSGFALKSVNIELQRLRDKGIIYYTGAKNSMELLKPEVLRFVAETGSFSSKE